MRRHFERNDIQTSEILLIFTALFFFGTFVWFPGTQHHFFSRNTLLGVQRTSHRDDSDLIFFCESHRNQNKQFYINSVRSEFYFADATESSKEPLSEIQFFEVSLTKNGPWEASIFSDQLINVRRGRPKWVFFFCDVSWHLLGGFKDVGAF